MDGPRFDAMTRALAAGANRRALLKSAAVAIAALAPFRTRVTLANATCGVACDDNSACNSSDDDCYSCCGGVCVNVSSDPSNCDACGHVCPGGPYAVCGDAICSLQCPDGQTNCGSYCADLTSDPQNCISCGAACAAGQSCCGAVGCVDLASDLHFCGSCGNDCGVGGRCCAATCVDPTSDPNNCGDCGVVCAADQNCQGGTCVARCPAGQLFCDPNCVDPSADPANCGACGNGCAAAEHCQGGACVSICAAGQTACGGACVDLSGDRNNCGGCGIVCDGGTNCVNAACVRPACPNGQTQCQDGCVDTNSDPGHCGGCHNACISSGMSCCSGACVDLKTDPNHCGRCDFACPPGFTCDGKGCVRQDSGDGFAGGAFTASPDFCVTKARSQAAIDALFANVVIVTPAPTPSSTQIANGAKTKVKRATPAVTQTIADAVMQISACGSANDPARQIALMTDRMASAWLAERAFTPEALAAAPRPLPPPSWEVVSSISPVYELTTDLASALVTFAPRAPSLPARSEVHIFAKHDGRWLLDAIRREDEFTAETGSVALRIFDCPAGASAYDPALPCEPSPELRFDYELTSADGTVRKSAADARYIETGLLIWDRLAPGVVHLRPITPSGIGLATVMAGGATTADDRLIIPVQAGKNPAVVDIFHERTGITDALLRLRVDANCPPCSRKDLYRGICIPTCPPCSNCRSVDVGGGRVVSSCRSACGADQVCAFDSRLPGDPICCIPVGGACAADDDCCEHACVDGACSCAPAGESCAQQAGCCQGAKCDGNPLVCTACKFAGATCSSSAECCNSSCYDGTCRCCAGVENDDFTKTHFCCAFPHAFLEVADSPQASGFKRCCVVGVDCLGDPLGPHRGPDFSLAWAPVRCP